MAMAAVRVRDRSWVWVLGLGLGFGSWVWVLGLGLGLVLGLGSWVSVTGWRPPRGGGGTLWSRRRVVAGCHVASRSLARPGARLRPCSPGLQPHVPPPPPPLHELHLALRAPPEGAVGAGLTGSRTRRARNVPDADSTARAIRTPTSAAVLRVTTTARAAGAFRARAEAIRPRAGRPRGPLRRRDSPIRAARAARATPGPRRRPAPPRAGRSPGYQLCDAALACVDFVMPLRLAFHEASFSTSSASAAASAAKLSSLSELRFRPSARR